MRLIFQNFADDATHFFQLTRFLRRGACRFSTGGLFSRRSFTSGMVDRGRARFQVRNDLAQSRRVGLCLRQHLFERGQFIERRLFGLAGQFADAGGHAVAPAGGEARKIFLHLPTRFAQQRALNRSGGTMSSE